jgi:hypothetical protein
MTQHRNKASLPALFRAAPVPSAGAVIAVAAMFLASACGGSAPDDPPFTTSYLSWNGSSNAEVVLDRTNDRFRVRADDGGVESLSGTQMNGLRVRNAVFELNGSPLGVVELVPGSSGGRVAAFRCNSGVLADIVFEPNNTYTLDCTGTPPPAPAPPPSSGNNYVFWNGSANGNVVLDRDNQHFRVRASNGQVETESGVSLIGLVVSGSTVLSTGGAIGSVTLLPGASGGNVAAFRCNNGNLLDVVIGTSQYNLVC